MLQDSELKLKVHGDVTLQSEGLVACATDGDGGKPDVAGKLCRVHHWVGMNGYQ